MPAIFDQGPPPPCPMPFNLAAYVLTHAEDSPDKVALEVLGGETLTFAGLDQAVGGIATGLLQSGLKAGDRLLLRLGNRLEFPLGFLAAIRIGIVPIPTSAQLTTPEVNKLVADCGPTATLAEDGLALPDGDLPVITCDDMGAMRPLPPASPVMGDPHRLAYIIFTSGTSGVQRGVCHAHRAIWARRMMHDGWYGLGSNDRLLHAGAFNWTYTLGTGLLDPWSVGATALIPLDGTPAEALPALLKTHHATIFAAAPGVYRKMLSEDADFDLPELRHGLAAGEHLSETLRQDWTKRTGTGLHQAYGMSECSTFISSSPAHPAPPDTSGRPQVGRRIAILGDDGQPTAHDTPGGIAVATTDLGLMLGYLNDTPVKGDWFTTGDMGQMAQDGTITYLGRGDDMMNPGGTRVSPVEVEAAMTTHAGVDACAAVQVAIKADTNVIALYYTAAAPLDEQTLRAHAEQNLARYKQPRLYFHIGELPYGGNGKLNRRALRDSFEAS